MILELVVGLIVLLGIFLVLKTRKMNNDPLQNKLAANLIGFSHSDYSVEEKAHFNGACQIAFLESGVIDRETQAKRMTHALSMVKAAISSEDFEKIKAEVYEYYVGA